MKENLSMFSLEGKTAVITGGAGVLGSFIAKKGLGKAGAKIALCDIVNADKVAQELEVEGIIAIRILYKCNGYGKNKDL